MSGPGSHDAPSRPRPAPSGDITRWLVEWTGGDREALDRLIPHVYSELRRLARGYLSRRAPHHSLQPTALINELFLRLIDRESVDWQNRAHFFGVAAKTMRGILVDDARRRAAAKRGGGEVTICFDEAIGGEGLGRERELLSLDDALSALATVDPKLAELVELRFFGGLTIEETAVALGVSPVTVKRSWQTARSWLRREMRRGESG